MISNFIEYDFSEVNFHKEYNQKRFLIIRLLSLTISFSILIPTVIAGLFGYYNIDKDLIFYSLVFIMWLMINVQFMVSTPKDYRTRKLLYSMKSKYNFL
jgi:membrane protein YdbS with pleckstrin-like domain